MLQTQKHMNAEDVVAQRNWGVEPWKQSKKKRDKRPKIAKQELKTRIMPNQETRPREAKASAQWNQAYTPLNSFLKQVLMYVRNDPSLKWPEKLKNPSEKMSQRKYCQFHWDHGHNIEDCFDLKEHIKMFIQQGRLRHFVASHPQAHPKADKGPLGSKSPELEIPQEIKINVGGPARGGESNSTWKAHSRKIRVLQVEVYSIDSPQKLPQVDQQDVTFTEEASRRVQHPHDNGLVVILVIANHRTRMVLIDNGSLTDILYFIYFKTNRDWKRQAPNDNSTISGIY